MGLGAAALLGGIAATGSAVGAGISAANASSMNKRAERYNRWATEQNFAEAARNRDWQAAQTEKLQTEYFDRNYSIAAQARQYREAGLNPNFMQGASVSNPGTSSSGAVGAADMSMNAAQTNDAGDIIGRGISNAANIASSAMVNESQAKKNDSETSWNLSSMTDRLETLHNENKLSDLDYNKAKQMLSYDLSIRASEKEQSMIQTDIMRIQKDSVQFDLDVNRWRFTNFSEMEIQKYRLGIQQDIANLCLTAARENYTQAQTSRELANIKNDYMNAVSNRINANANMKQANVAESLAPSQIEYNQSAAGNQRSQGALADKQAVGQQNQNNLYKKTEKLIVGQMQKSYDLLTKQNNMYYFEKVTSGFRDIGIGIGSGVGGFTKGMSLKPVGSIKGFAQ